MAMLNAFTVSPLTTSLPILPNSSFFPPAFFRISSGFTPFAAFSLPRKKRGIRSYCCSSMKNELHEPVDSNAGDAGEEIDGDGENTETLLYSFSPLSLLFVAAFPGAGTVRSLFGPFVELVKSWNLPDWLVHWGHPGNMAVVLFAMGGYGTYLGFRIRFSDDVEEKAKAKDLHPKLLGGMFFFFALGATGGITSLLTSDKPIFESPHAVTGFIGLALLTIQTILPALFEGNPGLRNVHGILGSGIMTLFLIHAALGLQLGLSY